MQSDLDSHASRFRVQKKCFGVGDVFCVQASDVFLEQLQSRRNSPDEFSIISIILLITSKEVTVSESALNAGVQRFGNEDPQPEEGNLQSASNQNSI